MEEKMLEKLKRRKKLSNQDRQLPNTIQELINRYDLDNKEVYEYLIDLYEQGVIVSPTEPTIDRRKIWIQKGNNLFNIDNISQNTFITDTGEIQTNERWLTSEIIEVKPLIEHTWSADSANKNLPYQMFIAEYDDNKILLKYTWLSSETNYSMTITTQSDTKYMRVGCRNDRDYTKLQLEQNSTRRGYNKYIKPKIYIKNNNDVYEKLYTQEIIKGNATLNNNYFSSSEYNDFYVKNGIAFVNICATLKANSMEADTYVLVSDLPVPNASFQNYQYVFNGAPFPVRLFLGSSGRLSWWYNEDILLHEGDILTIHLTYPVK